MWELDCEGYPVWDGETPEDRGYEYDHETARRIRTTHRLARDERFKGVPADPAQVDAMSAAQGEALYVLGVVIAVSWAWVKQEEGVWLSRAGGPSGGNIGVLVGILVEKLNIALEAMAAVGPLTLGAWPDLLSMLRAEDVDALMWPQGLTEARVIDLGYFGGALRAKLGPE